MSPGDEIQVTVDHLFRHESGKMISVLARLLGLQNLETAQDIVQDTLVQAMASWSYSGMPANPSAWLYRVAKNKAIDFIRRDRRFRTITSEYSRLVESEYTLTPTVNSIFHDHEIQDSVLRMIFACCHPAIPVESQIALALKTLCGLSTLEIAKAFLTGEETISKRIYRAKEKIRSEQIQLDMPMPSQISTRLDGVLHCLYLLFNEGYNSSHPDQLIREDMCEEAMRLTYLLTRNELTNQPRTNALLALFCFQASRFAARQDDKGNIILLKLQDRRLWYRPLISKGFHFLELATVKESTIYHLEAAIAYLHAVAPSFEDTDWKAIYYLYGVLFKHHPSPVVALNKAIAAGYAVNTSSALEELLKIKGLEHYYLYQTALGEVYSESGFAEQAKHCFQKALALTRSSAEQQLILSKLNRCLPG
jgi:RNA polymerase sigma factor (sigma-70 family)